ncbi:uncharacterized protein LOC110619781 isoform X7 [Manihot esculenta]|uniref:uncharacterized protein LOC110619781 isoform X7 n=1 Tax=Manihot esculenta TaxID=3983 RepID=UPI000B5D3639|nr:uncharacterized protein LOC110619781 isoform X7 [Manihot esculenta]XP_043814501.1 uncharacterized protein LOC110619781 isoform X7 [Manihot esculenta]
MEPLQKLHVVDVVDYDVEKSSHHHQSDDEEQKSSSSESGSSSEIMKESRSSMSEVDLERVVPEIKVHLVKIERDCRICHLSLDAGNLDSGLPIELGCSCKDDLASAHKHCAEAWFKIKGNKYPLHIFTLLFYTTSPYRPGLSEFSP